MIFENKGIGNWYFSGLKGLKSELVESGVICSNSRWFRVGTVLKKDALSVWTDSPRGGIIRNGVDCNFLGSSLSLTRAIYLDNRGRPKKV